MPYLYNHISDSVKEGMLITEAHHRMRTILIAYRASSEKISELFEREWYDPKLDRRGNKDRMKEIGGAIQSYERFLREMTISAAAMEIESLIVLIRQLTRAKFDIWSEDNDNFPYINDARKTCALHNVLKHNCGIIESSKSKSSKYLVAKCRIPNESEVYCNNMHLESLLFSVFAFLIHLITRVDRKSTIFDTIKEERLKELFESLVPDSISLSNESNDILRT